MRDMTLLSKTCNKKHNRTNAQHSTAQHEHHITHSQTYNTTRAHQPAVGWELAAECSLQFDGRTLLCV